MRLLTIGEFAKASRLSPKALRLYGELGLLAPDRVDPDTGYRYYLPQQLERARLVAWLRRIGMPLARIRDVCALDAPAAAREIRAYWDQVEEDTAARRDLATFLIGHLSGKAQGKDTAMSYTDIPLTIRYAALTDTGQVRESNQDAVYAGSRLLAVADGFGGSGGPASSAAIDTLKRIEQDGPPAGEVLNALQDSLVQAGRAVRDVAPDDAGPQQVGTTLTAMLWTGSQLALVHIGDSRAHLMRGGELFQITHDHTVVQSLLDEGRISPAEAAVHPQRALLARALTGEVEPSADTRLCGAQLGVRYLLCSDGLSAVVPAEDIRQVMTDTADPEPAVRELVAEANRNGAPDNVSCVIADVVADVTTDATADVTTDATRGLTADVAADVVADPRVE